jgi:hypothetical protein
LKSQGRGCSLIVDMTGKDAVGVVDRENYTVIKTWPTGQVAKHLVAMSFEEAGHRLLVSTRDPVGGMAYGVGRRM